MWVRGTSILILGIGALGGFTGCGPATATVSGEVLVDGKPMPKGIISYIPADKTGTPVTANIEEGRYQIRTTTGKMVVQISQPIVMGKKPQHNGPNAPLMEITQENLPPRYNSSTDLNVELTAGINTIDWSVKSIKSVKAAP